VSVSDHTTPAGGWLAGKRALVVGAGSGIGRAVCDAFVAEGARVAALERDRAKCAELKAALASPAVVEGDATTLADNRRAVEAALDAYGGLDILVSTVGVFDFYRGLRQIDDDVFDAAFGESFATNVRSPLCSVKAALPALEASGGNVVLTASTSSFFAGRGGVLYVSSKFAVRGLVVALAQELAPRIRVNAVAPGGTVGTDLRGLTALGLGDQRLEDRAGRTAELVQRTPLALALEPADHAGSYVFLASDRARGITGSFVHPDGGIGVKA
jgi:NAD(P)-dependent dehydrogenase (short-subunit alcohol dehydrogenase family)